MSLWDPAVRGLRGVTVLIPEGIVEDIVSFTVHLRLLEVDT